MVTSRVHYTRVGARTKDVPEEAEALQRVEQEAPAMIDYDEFQAEVRRLKRERWAKILASEPPGREPGRRPRDPEQERMLLRMDRARVQREQPSLSARKPRSD